MLNKLSQFATSTFLLWMLVAAIIGFIFPSQLASLGTAVPWLLGIVMLGMGMTINPRDFKAIFQTPKPVIIGVILQFTIMAYVSLPYCKTIPITT